MRILLQILAFLSLLAGSLSLVLTANLIYGLTTGAFEDGRGMAILVMQTWGALSAVAALVTGGLALRVAPAAPDHPDLDQAQVLQVAVHRGGRTLAGLLNGVHRELHRDAAGRDDAVTQATGQIEVDAVAR